MDYATKDDVREALVPYLTRNEFHTTLAGYPTRDEMRELMREEGERTRRYFDVIAESLRDDIRLLAEGLVALSQRVDSLAISTKAGFASVEQRLMRLEARKT